MLKIEIGIDKENGLAVEIGDKEEGEWRVGVKSTLLEVGGKKEQKEEEIMKQEKD